MDEQLLAQLNRRIEEHHQGLCDRLDRMGDALQTIYALLVARMEAHEAYHQRHEHRWGLVKLAGRYPFRLAALAFAGAWALLAGAGGSAQWVGDLARRLIKLFMS